MSTPLTPIDLARQRRRLMVMLAVDALCVVVALVAVIGFLSFHIAWLGAVFALAVLTGFGAQIWLMMGLKPGRSGHEPGRARRRRRLRGTSLAHARFRVGFCHRRRYVRSRFLA